MLPQARMKKKAEAELASLVQTRDKLVKQRTQLLNKLHAHMTAHGLQSRREAYASERGLARVLQEATFTAIERIEVEVIVAQVRSLNEGIQRLDEEIKEQGPKFEGDDHLTSIKGIGTRSATILLSVLGDVADFQE